MFPIQRMVMGLGVALLMILGTMPAPRIAHAQDRLCFSETNQCVEGRFLEYWRQNGGLPVFGYPVSAATQERNRDTGKDYLTQWFERNRFELHPENRRPYDVLLGRLGDDMLLKLGRDWQREWVSLPPTSGECEAPSAGGKVFLLCPPFRDYYNSHGLEFDGQSGFSGAESLALFGLPLTQPKTETNSSGHTVLTQWFERARFEYHPNNPAPFKVLLGLLGNDLKRGSTPPEQTAVPAVVYVTQDGTLYERRGNGQPTRIGTTPNQGAVLDAVRSGDQIFVLREQGLQSVSAGQPARTLATFAKGNARFGRLLAVPNSATVLYSYSRNADHPMGFDGIAGVIENGSARKVHEARTNLRVLGVSKDERAMYLIEQGQDPSFGQVRVVSLAEGRVLADLPVAGAGAVELSPDRETIAAVDQPSEHPDTLVFYDLRNQTGAPRNARPRVGWNIWDAIWAPNSRVVYAKITPTGEPAKGELWRVDPVTLRGEIVAKDLPLEMRFLNVSSEGRWLLTQVNQSIVFVDLTTGRTTPAGAVPDHAVIAR